jgi:hypothetical protein
LVAEERLAVFCWTGIREIAGDGSGESAISLARRAVAKSFTLTVPHAYASIRAVLLSGWEMNLHDPELMGCALLQLAS